MAHYSNHHADKLIEMAQVMGDVMSARVKVDWMDQILQMIHEDRERHILFQNVYIQDTS